jgi:hypothetical protein
MLNYTNNKIRKIEGYLYMNKVKIIIVSLLCFQFLFSENKIIYFNGGKEYFGLAFQSRLFSDSDIGNLNFGNTNSSSILSTGQFRANPAVLGYYTSSSISLDLNPGFDINGVSTINSIMGDGEFDNLVNGGLVSGLQASGMAGDLFDIEDTTQFNTDNFGLDITPNASQKRSINGISAVISPLIGYQGEYGQIGISHRSLYDLNIELLTGGIALTIEDADTTSLIPTAVKLPLTIDMDMNLNINFNETDFGYGIELSQYFFDTNDKLAIGFGLNYINGSISNSMVLTINGMIRQIGEQDITAFFNDPSASYRNTLNDSILIDFSGKSFRPTFGVSYNHNKIYFDLSFTGQSKMEMNGNLNIVTHNMGALNPSFEKDGVDGIPDTADDEELFDMFLLKPSALTFTNRTIYNSKTLIFKYPGKTALSFAYKGKFFKTVFGFEKPIGEFSMLYECDISEDGQKKEENSFLTYCPEEGECDIQSEVVNKSYEIIASQNLISKFGLGLGKFYLGGSIVMGDLKFNGLLDADGLPREDILGIPLGGTFGMGFNLPITNNLNMDMSLLSFPGLAGFTTLTYSF